MKLTEFTYLNETYQNAKDKIVIAGMSHDGPINRPFLLEEDMNVSRLLGECQLKETYLQLLANGVSRDNIIIYRMNGSYGEIILSQNDIPFIKFRTVSGTDINKLIELSIQNNGIVITKYKETESEVSLDDENIEEVQVSTEIEYRETYIFNDYKKLSELVDEINQDASLGMTDVIAKEYFDADVSMYFKEYKDLFFSNSDSEEALCLKEEDSYENYKPLYWNKFHSSIIGETYNDFFYTKISEIKAELIIFTDVYYDLFPEVGTYVAKLAEQIEDEQDLYISSVIGTSTVPVLKEIPEGYSHISKDDYYNEDGEEVKFDIYSDIKKYIENLKSMGLSKEKEESYMNNLQVVIGSEFDTDTESNIPMLGAYSGTYVSTHYSQPISNKRIINNNELNDRIFKSDIASLTNYGYICIVPSIRRGNVAYRSQSFELKTGKMLNQLNNKRIYGIIKKDIKVILDRYIGKQRRLMNAPDLAKMLDEYFDMYYQNKYIAAYSFEVPSQRKGDQQTNYDIKINLTLYGEVFNINGNFIIEPEENGGITVWETIND